MDVEEKWQPINDWYDVSSLGRVRSWKNNRHGRARSPRILRANVGSHGYPVVHVGKSRTVHSLVAEAFLVADRGDGRPKQCINHKDGDKTNNRASNLEVVTYGDNNKHAFDTGLKEPTRGSRHGISKLTEGDVVAIKFWMDNYPKSPLLQEDIAAAFGVSRAVIANIKGGRIWKHV